MRRPILALLVSLAAVLVAAAPAAAAAKPSYLFTITSSGGTLVHDDSGWWITLTGTSPIVTRFSDRPQRLASTMTPAAFARAWRGYGFAADPPNAALVIADGPAEADVFVVELRRPRVRGTRVTFRAKPIRTSSSALRRYHARRDRPRELAFGPASLFIDDASATVYQPLTLQFENVQPGQSIVVSIIPYGGIPVGFSSGPALNSASGLQVIAQSGSVPVDHLSVTSNQIRIQTASSGYGGTLAFALPLYLAAGEGVERFVLQSSADTSILVWANVGTDGLAEAVHQGPTLLDWD